MSGFGDEVQISSFQKFQVPTSKTKRYIFGLTDADNPKPTSGLETHPQADAGPQRPWIPLAVPHASPSVHCLHP